MFENILIIAFGMASRNHSKKSNVILEDYEMKKMFGIHEIIK